ncbi:MAG: BrnT family toxin [Candidatus Competibacteraceae bacterium]|nr:BrnT family toxin [Candidatus Competibacteraceae bacterium]MCB1812516.1 BrnT family toxin [Candidatus Competibacteraceae bacterium]
MITWDDNKRQRNIVKHGIDFIGAETIFDYPMLTREDDRAYADGEQRLQSLALLEGHIVFVVWVERAASAHIISIRKAERHEQKIYRQATSQ